jgi:hypothetical protein
LGSFGLLLERRQVIQIVLLHAVRFASQDIAAVTMEHHFDQKSFYMTYFVYSYTLHRYEHLRVRHPPRLLTIPASGKPSTKAAACKCVHQTQFHECDSPLFFSKWSKQSQRGDHLVLAKFQAAALIADQGGHKQACRQT